MKRSTPKRRGKVTPEQRQIKREALEQMRVEAEIRQRALTLTVDDLDRVPPDIRAAVESVTAMGWNEFVGAIQDNLNLEIVTDAKVAAELQGNVDAGPSSV